MTEAIRALTTEEAKGMSLKKFERMFGKKISDLSIDEMKTAFFSRDTLKEALVAAWPFGSAEDGYPDNPC